jgi:protoporphyrinogen IX oxidase
MTDMLAGAYPWVKSLHVMAVIAWMAGLFYLPRLFVYHVEGLAKKGVVQGSDMDLLFQHQERLLLRAIMNPSMIVAWVLGLMLVMTPQAGVYADAPWVWAKGLSLVGMTWFHIWLAVRRKEFVAGKNRLRGRDYRIMNEVPTVLMVVIVLSVIVKF